MFRNPSLPGSLLTELYDQAADQRGLNHLARSLAAYQPLILYEALCRQLEVAMFGPETTKSVCLAASADLQTALDQHWAGLPQESGHAWDFLQAHLVDAGPTYCILARTPWMAEQAVFYLNKSSTALAFDTISLADPEERADRDQSEGIPFCEIGVRKLQASDPQIFTRYTVVPYQDLVDQSRWGYGPNSDEFVLAVFLNEEDRSKTRSE